MGLLSVEIRIMLFLGMRMVCQKIDTFDIKNDLLILLFSSFLSARLLVDIYLALQYIAACTRVWHPDIVVNKYLSRNHNLGYFKFMMSKSESLSMLKFIAPTYFLLLGTSSFYIHPLNYSVS